MKLKLSYQSIAVISVALCLSACSLGPIKVFPPKTYTLSDLSTQKPLRATSPATLMVMPVTASRGFDSTSMLYQAAPYQLASFVKSAWLSPPANMMTPLLFKSLQQSGLFQVVILGPAMNSTSYVLNTRLLSLYQDFTVNPSQIVLSLDVSLGSAQDNKIMADHIINVKVNAAENTPYAGVIAANQALSQILDDVADFVNESISIGS